MFDSNSNTHIDKKKFILLFGTITKITSNDVNIFHGGVGKKIPDTLRSVSFSRYLHTSFLHSFHREEKCRNFLKKTYLHNILNFLPFFCAILILSVAILKIGKRLTVFKMVVPEAALYLEAYAAKFLANLRLRYI